MAVSSGVGTGLVLSEFKTIVLRNFDIRHPATSRSSADLNIQRRNAAAGSGVPKDRLRNRDHRCPRVQHRLRCLQRDAGGSTQNGLRPRLFAKPADPVDPDGRLSVCFVRVSKTGPIAR